MDYIKENIVYILDLLVDHIELTLLAVLFAVLIGIPLGIISNRFKKIKVPILGGANIIQAIPSIALLGLLIPLFGIGEIPAIIAVTLYSLLPIIKNTNTGIRNIPPELNQVAKGIGLTTWQRLYKVQLPLALPVIMAGIRISAVTAVGLVTLAAYIGANGLGKLVMSGISSMNTGKILAGALPACILALVIDALFSIIEKLVTPIGLLKKTKKKKSPEKIKKHNRVLAIVLVIIVLLFFVLAAVPKMFQPKYDITIGSKTATEPEVINYIYSDYIESKTDLKVDRKTGLGDTQPIYGALMGRDIDILVGYSGTVYCSVLGYQVTEETNLDNMLIVIKDEMEEKYNVVTFDPVKFNNTYTFAITKENQVKYNLETFSDLATLFNSRDDFVLGATYMFADETRMDGLIGVEKKYGFSLKNNELRTLDSALRYQAIDNDEVQVIDAYSTDGLLSKYDLYVLKDDKDFFPAYNMIPMINKDVYEKYPELICVNDLKDVLTNEVMQELNYQIDVEHKDARIVAHEFLVENNLIEE